MSENPLAWLQLCWMKKSFVGLFNLVNLANLTMPAEKAFFGIYSVSVMGFCQHSYVVMAIAAAALSCRQALRWESVHLPCWEWLGIVSIWNLTIAASASWMRGPSELGKLCLSDVCAQKYVLPLIVNSASSLAEDAWFSFSHKLIYGQMLSEQVDFLWTELDSSLLEKVVCDLVIRLLQCTCTRGLK